MKSIVLAAAAVAAFALPAAAQMPTTGMTTPMIGQVQPTSGAVKVEITVKPGLAHAAKISADSAFAIARAHASNGTVSSAKLGTRDGRLVYMVEVLNQSKRETSVVVNAMNGKVLEATEHGGLRAATKHHAEKEKLEDAKDDSASKHPMPRP